MTIFLVVTTISPPTPIMRALAEGSVTAGWEFIVIGDRKSPAEFNLESCRFYSLDRQRALGFRIEALLPVDHYARKNLGYLIALGEGSSTIVETDDDNWPTSAFFERRTHHRSASVIDGAGWVNVYRYFTDEVIWPRGLPLDGIHSVPVRPPPSEGLVDCPIQQGLADDNPDVDAIYRLIFLLPIRFARAPDVALGMGSWCPFNSQNTSWTRLAAPLLYLPSYCSFRVSDIWRSLVAQRVAWEHGWRILFHGPTVRQERNPHVLMQDFRDEIPGHINNQRIAESLESVSLQTHPDRIGDNLMVCYERLVSDGILDARELILCRAWLDDVAAQVSRARNDHGIAREKEVS